MAIEFQKLNETLSINLKKKNLKDWVDDIQGYYMKDLDSDELDRRFASQAIGFVIKHSRKGVVSLCTAVATLLQEKYRLQLSNKRLERKLSYLKGENDASTSSSSSLPCSVEVGTTPSDLIESQKVADGETNVCSFNRNVLNCHKQQHEKEATLPCSCHNEQTHLSSLNSKSGTNIITVAEIHSPPHPKKRPNIESSCTKCSSKDLDSQQGDSSSKHEIHQKMTKEVHKLDEVGISLPLITAPSPLISCICQRCKNAMFGTKPEESSKVFALIYNGEPILRIGDTAVTKDDLVGLVEYIGHMDDSHCKDAVYVRLKIDNGPDGIEHKTNGSASTETRNLLLSEVRCIVKSQH